MRVISLPFKSFLSISFTLFLYILENDLIDIMMSIIPQVRKLSHKQFRSMLKKFRRKKKRQQFAKGRDENELFEQQKKENSPNYKEREEERLRCLELYEQYEERERVRKHKLWLLKEEQAQAEFKKKQELLELEKIRREEERKRIVAEFEKQQLLETQLNEENEKIKSKKEEALQQALSNLPEGDGPWHNPIAPLNYNAGEERSQCQFFAKTGCCRFGERCSRGHIRPEVSCTILVKGMYSHFSIDQTGRDDYDTDMGLEFEDKETYGDFENFYVDVLPEFRKCGKVVQFKVCSNFEPHLRGNVYVQFSREEEAVEAYKSFHGRFYAGRQLTCEFTNVIKWRSAICGLYERHLCPKGINCNFLHVFRNPKDEFWEADRDLPPREKRYSSQRHRGNYKSDKQSYKYSSSHHRYYRDYSPETYRNNYSRNKSHHHRRSSESDDSHDGTSTLKRRNSERGNDYTGSRDRKRSRNSRSRSCSPAYSSEEERHQKKKHKHNKKKKSKKVKRSHSQSDSDN